MAWYNGHPDYADHEFDLDCERAVVIGNGNVAVDVGRMLMLDPDELGFPFRDLVRFKGMEGEEHEILCDGRDSRHAYLEALTGFLESTRRALQEVDIEYHQVYTSTRVDRALVDFLAPRAREGAGRGTATGRR